ncbi:hypothetical protein [Falsiroseomonas sp.]|uniref:hypothetical protein n=1 Tax=Falsiroseomonas sp. TaxID=2870721 RepID=UPI002733887E|nr:hypothetical protein [Falsiroseomonas sp.]MDP3415497.1 hypothetical protein [Falsiroseomonas sp.]
MAETLSWSVTMASSSGAGVASHGALVADGTSSASVQLDAGMAAAAPLTLQLDNVDRIAFLGLVPSLTDGSVEVQADGAAATKLSGPLMLFGGAVKLFAGDLSTLKAQNRHTTKAATLSVLIGLKLGA